MNVTGKIEERLSEKTGKKYYVLVVKVTETYEKTVFLDKAEVELLKITHSK